MSKARGTNPLREKILDAAVKLLRESGLKKLAQPQVAKAAGIPQGHLTYYFPKRADLLIAIAEHTIRSVTSLVSGHLPLTAALRAKVTPLIAAMVSDTHRTRMLLGLVVESDENPELRTRLKKNMAEVTELIAAGLGLDSDDPQAHLKAAAFWGLGIQHYLMDGERTEEETRKLIEALLEGSAPRKKS